MTVRGFCLSGVVVVVCLDGCGPDYLHAAKMPFVESIGAEGLYVDARSIVPSVTNLNAVSILTGKYPR